MSILLLLIPLLCIFILNLPRRSAAARSAPWIVGFACLLQALIALTAHTSLAQPLNDMLVLPLPIELVIDPISAVFLFMIALVVTVANTVGIGGKVVAGDVAGAGTGEAAGAGGDARNKVIASSLILICMAGMDGVVMVRDLFSLYIFLEITALSAFVLIALRKSLEALSGAFKYFILSGLASLAIMLANALIFMQIGNLSFAVVGTALSSDDQVVQIALILYTVAFCIKAGVAPFHGWLPDAYSSASSAISVLLAGVITNVAGAYVIIRLMNDVFVGLVVPSQAFMVLGAFTIVIGAFAAIGQKEMKRMLAFSSISQMGYIIIAAGLATPLALIGAVVHFVNQALFKSLLFVNAAAVEEQTGTTEFDKLGGLAERLKVTGWTSTIGVLSTAGIPPLSGFWSKLLIVIALVIADQWFYAALVVLMSLVTLGYFLILQRKVFFGKLREGFEELREARGPLVGAAVALAALTTCLGLLFPVVLVVLQGFGLV